MRSSRKRSVLLALAALMLTACPTNKTNEPKPPQPDEPAPTDTHELALPPPPPVLYGTVPDTALRQFKFAGYTWSIEVARPGDSPPTTIGGFSGRHAWVENGDLQLRLGLINGVWQGASVVSSRRGWGYGTYRWTVKSRADGFHPSAVVGLFTYQAGAPGNREIDIEIARFGRKGGPQNMVVGRYARNGNRFTQTWAIGDHAPTVHRFTWRPGWIRWVSRDRDTGAILHRSKARTDVVPGNERVHMNLWICCNRAPARPQHVAISDFTFVPLK